MKQKSLPLDSKFWTRFASSVWEKNSRVFADVESPVCALDAVALFNLLVSSSDHCRKLKDAQGFKFYIEGDKLSADFVLEVLPVKKDKSLEGYHQRMSARFSDYCLVCDELLKVNRQTEILLGKLLNDLYAEVGIPNRFTEMGLYLGNYKKTPFGVHVDGCGVFSFPVVGTKKFRVWSSEFVKKNPALDSTFNYTKFRKDSQLLTAKPGDMAYWPSSAWHIAESSGTFSATWSLGVWVDQDPLHDLSQVLTELLRKKLGPDADRGMTKFKDRMPASGSLARLPPAYERNLKMLNLLSKTELNDAFQIHWAKHVSKLGFRQLPRVPSQSRDPLPYRGQLKLADVERPLIWFESKSAVSCFFGGQMTERTVTASRRASSLRLLEQFNDGSVCRVSREEWKWLRPLAAVGAFEW